MGKFSDHAWPVTHVGNESEVSFKTKAFPSRLTDSNAKFLYPFEQQIRGFAFDLIKMPLFSSAPLFHQLRGVSDERQCRNSKYCVSKLKKKIFKSHKSMILFNNVHHI